MKLMLVDSGRQSSASLARVRAVPSAALIRSRNLGFTLVEIVVTLAIVGLLIAFGLGSNTTLIHRRALEEPISKVQEFAKKARNRAILEQRPYMLEITPQAVAIYSLVSTEGATAGGFGAAQSAAPKGQVEYYDFDPDVALTVRRWRAKDFSPPGRQIWIFERSGLCEPLAVRADSEHGFIEVSFNALDAHVDDKTSEIR